MRPLSVERLAEYVVDDVLVTAWSTIRVKHNAYSVPSRLIGEWVRVRLFDDRLEVSFRGKDQLVVDRLHGRNGHSINYRHIIWSLVQKPGAFALYRYREDLFPSLIFRRAYDSLLAKLDERKATSSTCESFIWQPPRWSPTWNSPSAACLIAEG